MEGRAGLKDVEGDESGELGVLSCERMGRGGDGESNICGGADMDLRPLRGKAGLRGRAGDGRTGDEDSAPD